MKSERESDGHSWGGPQPKRARLCALGCVVCLSAYSEEEAEAPRGVHACETASAGVHALPCEARVRATTVFPLFMTLTSVQDASLSEEQREGET